MPGRSVRCRSAPSKRGVSPIVGIVVLLAITVALATVVAVGASTLSTGSIGPTAAFELTVDGATIEIDHVAGDAIDVGALSVTIAVGDVELTDQPPVPFVGADGFDGAPTGPFNAEADDEWRSGTAAGLTVAETNSPTIERGDRVRVDLVADGDRIGTLETTAR